MENKGIERKNNNINQKIYIYITPGLGYLSLADTELYCIKLVSDSYYGRCLLIPMYFCAVYDYAGKADLSKGY